jgi:hypothetical protein
MHFYCNEVHYSSQQFQIYVVFSLVTSRISVLQHYAYCGVCTPILIITGVNKIYVLSVEIITAE